MTVRDNIMVGCHCRTSTRLPRQRAAPAARRRPRSERIARARRRAHRRSWTSTPFARPPGRRPALRRSRSASSWPARWPAEPKLLLLDEPAAGLNHEEVDELARPDPRRARPPGHHRAAGRAPHEPGDGGLRPGRRARTSAARSPKARPAEVQQQPGRDPRPTWGRRPEWLTLLEVKELERLLRRRRRCCTTSSFSLEPGGITTLLGANGAGKTTTLRAHVPDGAHRAAASSFDGQQLVGQGHRGASCGWAWPTCPRAAAPSPT